jgi:hypothetical protein
LHDREDTTTAMSPKAKSMYPPKRTADINVKKLRDEQ